MNGSPSFRGSQGSQHQVFVAGQAHNQTERFELKNA
jgi:hypothetical protein